MSSDLKNDEPRPLRRVLILADESAGWRVAGLRQLERLALTLQEFARTHGAIDVCVYWDLPATARAVAPLSVGLLPHLHFFDRPEDFLQDERGCDLVLSTRVFLFRESVPELLAHLSASERSGAVTWNDYARNCAAAFQLTDHAAETRPWRWLNTRRDISASEAAFLRGSGKSQDGLVSRYVNRPISRTVSRWLLKTPLTPNAWSVGIFSLPLIGCGAFLRGSHLGFIVGCAVYQLYSILDGCDGEIARARFLQSEFGRRLDSFLDLVGNLLLALALGLGLARQSQGFAFTNWFFVTEGIATAVLIVLSEGIVFVRRTRAPASALVITKWNGALYQRHHEFLERSGIMFLGDRFVFWLVQLTKRDMAMLGFLILAIAGWPEVILHLLLLVAGVNSILAGTAYLRPIAPRLAPEAG